MHSINIHEAKTHLSRFVEEAASGQEIVIARAGKPVARLVALEASSSKTRELGLGRGQFNIPADFDRRDEAAVEAMFYGARAGLGGEPGGGPGADPAADSGHGGGHGGERI